MIDAFSDIYGMNQCLSFSYKVLVEDVDEGVAPRVLLLGAGHAKEPLMSHVTLRLVEPQPATCVIRCLAFLIMYIFFCITHE